MVLRPMTELDLPAAMQLKDKAGWNQTLDDWRLLLRASPGGCFVATEGEIVVGTLTSIVYSRRLAWIGMVLVSEPHRGKGIATALLKHAIENLDHQGIASIKLDATPAGKPLYKKLGFVAEYDIERWGLQRSITEAAACPETHSVTDVLPLDLSIFGADRAFVLQDMHARASAFLLVKKDSSMSVRGYSLGRRGALADQLGPWVAFEKETAAELLDEFLRRSKAERIFVDCVLPTIWSKALVVAAGFTFSRGLTRMYRGHNQYAGKSSSVGAVLGPEFG